MIAATGIELRAGSRLLLDGATFRVAAGDRVGLVGRNGAGKTTLTKVLAGERPRRPPARSPAPARSATCRRTRAPATWTYSPATASCRPAAWTRSCATCARPRAPMASADDETRDKAMRRYARLEAEFTARGGYAAESEAASIAVAAWAWPSGCSASRCAPCPAVSAAGSSWPGSCSPAPRPCCSTSRPTTSTPTRSSGCATTSRPTRAGWSSSATTSSCSTPSSTRCSTSTPTAAELDIYNIGWKTYLQQRETDERRRKRERANAEKKAAARCMAQADKMRAKATKAVAAQNMAKRAERLLAGLEGERVSDKVAKLRFPEPAPCGKTPLTARAGCRGPTARWRSSPTSTWPSTGARGSSSSASTAPARPPCCGSSPASTRPTPARSSPGHGLKLGYYAQEHETLDVTRTVLENMQSAAPDARRDRGRARCSARSCSPATTSTSRPACCPAARRPGWRWPCWSCPAPTCCCSTSPPTTSTRPPARRSSARCAPTRARSCWSPTTRARSTRSSPSGSCSCPTASRTTGPRLRRPGRPGLSRWSEPHPPAAAGCASSRTARC